MPTIRFRKNYPAISCVEGEKLMTALLDGGMPVASSCGGEAVCKKCAIIILIGAENSLKFDESLVEIEQIPGECRILSCQASVVGDLVVDASYW